MASPPSIRTAIGAVRGLGPARAGTEHFWLQRMTAVANLLLVGGVVAVLVMLAGRDHVGARALIANPLAALTLTLFIISVCIHMRVGMQTIIEDYVHGHLAKIAALMANTFFAIVVAAASLLAILKRALGS